METINHTIEIIAGKQLIFDNISLITLTKEVTDELLLIELLYLKFRDRIKMLNLEKKTVYGIQFYRFDWSERMITTRKWNEKYDVHIFSELGYSEIRDIYNAIGFKLKHIEKTYYNSTVLWHLTSLK